MAALPEEQPVGPPPLRQCDVCDATEEEVVFPPALVGCRCRTIVAQYNRGERPVVICIGCLLEHFDVQSRCPGPCRNQITEVLSDEGNYWPVEPRVARVEELPGAEEQAHALAASLARGEDPWGDLQQVQDAELAALDRGVNE